MTCKFIPHQYSCNQGLFTFQFFPIEIDDVVVQFQIENRSNFPSFLEVERIIDTNGGRKYGIVLLAFLKSRREMGNPNNYCHFMVIFLLFLFVFAFVFLGITDSTQQTVPQKNKAFVQHAFFSFFSVSDITNTSKTNVFHRSIRCISHAPSIAIS